MTSQAGYFFNMCGAAVSWRSYKIKRVCHSSTEAEYVTCSDASRQAEYHVNVLGELGLYGEGDAVQIYTDSKGAEALVGNLVQRQRTKHIGTPYHYVRQLVDKGVMNFQRVDRSIATEPNHRYRQMNRTVAHGPISRSLSTTKMDFTAC